MNDTALSEQPRVRSEQSLRAEAAFRARVAELGATLLEGQWLGGHTPHRVMCSQGHSCSPRPANVNQGRHVCKRCSATGEPATERFWAKVEKTAGCWLWTGSTDRKGYGTFRQDARKPPLRAHQVSFEMYHGPVPAGLEVLHSCDNPPCVNPEHLSAGTHGKNVRESVERGRHSNGNQLKTHCPQGHPYDAVNTYVAPNGSRKCRICRREARRQCDARRAKNR